MLAHAAGQRVAAGAECRSVRPVATTRRRSLDEADPEVSIGVRQGAVARAVAQDRSGKCKRSVFAARYMVKLFKLGLLPSEVEEHYDDRFGADVYQYKNIDVKDSPVRGDPGAPITHRRVLRLPVPALQARAGAARAHPRGVPGQVKLYLQALPDSARASRTPRAAAQAAVAAGKQGKFWQFHDKLFDGDQEKESPVGSRAIRARAQARPHASGRGTSRPPPTRSTRIAPTARRLNIDSTPTLFINGAQIPRAAHLSKS